MHSHRALGVLGSRSRPQPRLMRNVQAEGFGQRSAERIASRLQAELSVEHIEDAVQQDVGECILLHFRGKHIGNQGASALAPALHRCTSLHWMHLKYNQTSNRGASARTDRRFLL